MSRPRTSPTPPRRTRTVAPVVPVRAQVRVRPTSRPLPDAPQGRDADGQIDQQATTAAAVQFVRLPGATQVPDRHDRAGTQRAVQGSAVAHVRDLRPREGGGRSEVAVDRTLENSRNQYPPYISRASLPWA